MVELKEMLSFYSKIISNDAEFYLSLLAVFAALLSALYAYRSNNIAQKALQISNAEFKSKLPNFGLYYNEGFRQSIIKADETINYLLFCITLTNKSVEKCSFKVELEIEYIRQDNSLAKVYVAHNPELRANITSKDLLVFTNEIELDAKGTHTKWLIFEQPKHFPSTSRLDKFTIIATEANGAKMSVCAMLIKEINNE